MNLFRRATLFISFVALAAAAGCSSDGDAEEGVEGHCFEEDGNCYCSAATTGEIGTTETSTCASSSDRICCAAPYSGTSEPYVKCSCYPGNSSCGGVLIEVDRCDGASYHRSSSGSGSCDQCSTDSDCDYACSSSERGVCGKDSGCGSCHCE